MYRIRLARDYQVYRGRLLRAGQWIWIAEVTYPGQPMQPGSAGYLVNEAKGLPTVETHWMFWTSTDLDATLVFYPDDIAELEAEDTEYNRHILTNAPFPVSLITSSD